MVPSVEFIVPDRAAHIKQTCPAGSERVCPMTERIEVIQGDITRQAVDAIVNAANPSLLGGGGVDGAIHAAAGPELLAECSTLLGCATGEAKITRGYRLSALWVIHTVGPMWHGGGHDEDALLARCYRNCFMLAVRHGITTIAFPAISAGVYRFPLERAAKIAVEEARRFLKSHLAVRKVIFVCFNGATLEVYRKVLAEKPHGETR